MQIACEQHQIGAFDGDVRAAVPNCHAHIRAYKRGSVVHPVAHHQNPIACGLETLDKPQLVLGQEARAELDDPRFGSDGGRHRLAVPGQQDNPPPNTNARIVKFTKDGKYVKEWGRLGTAPSEFRTPHALAFDARGRLFVADRGNHRIQIFDQEGKFLDAWEQFSRVSGLFVDRNDTLYAIDSESNPMRHPKWKTGVRIGSTKADKVVAFIPPHQTDSFQGVAGEGVAVDFDGNVYAAEGPISRQAAGGGITKYLKR